MNVAALHLDKLKRVYIAWDNSYRGNRLNNNKKEYQREGSVNVLAIMIRRR